ncbi:hypothetical protein MN116_003425 [Schistosoma mekongi]|uniref:Reticulocalbin-3 n=1 Tax=Schistosoma mekongi TaxID=38744 RepID=A0AAE1ZHJ5_SCHME|nr:hypothetical protein MN116_003425 [Schistosoma mekongi]
MDFEQEIKLFGKWSVDDLNVNDLSLTDYINIKRKGNPIVPHTAGRYQVKRFRKALCPLVERVCCSLMMHGRNNGKKVKAMNILKHTFEIIHLLSGENPIHVLVNAVLNSGAREDSTRIGRGGTVRRQAVDVSPLRRVNQAIYLLCTGAREAAFRNVKTISECLADELLNAAKIVDKIDLDSDGQITTEEMAAWISKVSKKMLLIDVDRAWKDLELSEGDKLSWEKHMDELFGEDGDLEDEDDETKKTISARDKRRWATADVDGDGKLSKEEYLAFLHPEYEPRMRQVIIKETMEDVDKNNDGFIDLDEYISKSSLLCIFVILPCTRNIHVTKHCCFKAFFII